MPPTQNQTFSKPTFSESSPTRVLTIKISFLRSVIYIIVLCVAVEAFSLISLSILGYDTDALFNGIGNTIKRPQAALYLSPNVGKYKVGNEFDVDVFVNTMGNDVVAVAAYLSYDKEKLQAINVDVSDTVFKFMAEDNILSKEGKIKITLGKPTPGVNTTAGKIGTVRFKALAATSAHSPNITFDYTKGSSLFSGVFIDDKKGTNALSSISGASIIVE